VKETPEPAHSMAPSPLTWCRPCEAGTGTGRARVRKARPLLKINLHGS
jgi:hypothetical protein